MTDETCEGRVDFALSAGIQHIKLHTERACRSLHIVCLGQGQREFRVDQRCKRVAFGHKLMGKLKSFWPHFLGHDGHTSDVAARVAETIHQAGLNWIATKATNCGYRGSRSLCRQS